MNVLYHSYPYPSRRSAIFADAMTLASNPLAAEAGRSILERGGNAIDAAIAMAAAQTVVEPTSNGIGSDLFTIFSYNGKIHAFNGSGKSPATISPAALRSAGYEKIPAFGLAPIGVPGAVDAWQMIHRKFGKLPFPDVLEPAIRYARDGFIVSPVVSLLWEKELKKRKACTGDVMCRVKLI